MEALGSFLALRSDLGEILEGLHRRSGKGTFQEAQPHFRHHSQKGGEGPYWKESLATGRTTGKAKDQITSPTPVDPQGVGGFVFFKWCAERGKSSWRAVFQRQCF